MTTSKDKVQQFMESPLVAWVSVQKMRCGRVFGKEQGTGGQGRRLQEQTTPWLALACVTSCVYGESSLLD